MRLNFAKCINLTMKYIERLDKLKDDSLVKLAFLEQKERNLDWYRGIEPILRVDPCFSADHVSAHTHRHNKSTQNSLSQVSFKHSSNMNKENFLFHNGFKKRIPPQTITPHKSKYFTPHVIRKSLKLNFKQSWLSSVQTSSKLEFYKEVKTEFSKENYLDTVQNYLDGASLTRLRISAHRLEIELGRRNKTSRSERTCAWCELTCQTYKVENESH